MPGYGRRNGNTLVEYGFIGALIAVALIGTVITLGHNMDNSMKGVKGNMDKNVEASAANGLSGTWQDDDPDRDRKWLETHNEDGTPKATASEKQFTAEGEAIQGPTDDSSADGANSSGPGGSTNGGMSGTGGASYTNPWNFKTCQPGEFCAR